MKGRCNTSGENVKAEVEYQTPVITQILEGLVGKAQGATATADKILEGYSAYVGQELVEGTLVKGVTGIDFGEVTLASTVASVTVSHNLGVIPSFVALIPKTLGDSTDYDSYLGFKDKVAIKSAKTVSIASSYVSFSDCENTLTTNEITFNGTSSHPWHPTDYYWIAIA